MVEKTEKSRTPWFNLDGYYACTVKYADGTKGTVLQHRELVEQRIGRKLLSSELVHHHDEDRSNNEDSNLSITTRSAHALGHAAVAEYASLVCAHCGSEFTRPASCERIRLRKGRTGPFCGKKCAGSFVRARQLANGQSNLRK